MGFAFADIGRPRHGMSPSFRPNILQVSIAGPLPGWWHCVAGWRKKTIPAAKQWTTTTSSLQGQAPRRTDGSGHVRASRRLRSSFRRPNHQGTNAGDDHEPRLSSAATPPSWWVHARRQRAGARCQTRHRLQTGKSVGGDKPSEWTLDAALPRGHHILAFPFCCAEGLGLSERAPPAMSL